ncbi:hypothetical protein Efla_004059 [Eimeria flavescens]
MVWFCVDWGLRKQHLHSGGEVREPREAAWRVERIVTVKYQQAILGIAPPGARGRVAGALAPEAAVLGGSHEGFPENTQKEPASELAELEARCVCEIRRGRRGGVTPDTVDRRLGQREVGFGATAVLCAKDASIRQKKEMAASEALRWRRADPPPLESSQADGVGSEETWHRGSHPNELPHGTSPLPQIPHGHGRLGRLETDLRQTQAKSAWADGRRTARAVRCPDCLSEAAVYNVTCLKNFPRLAVGGMTAGPPRWMLRTGHTPRSWKLGSADGRSRSRNRTCPHDDGLHVDVTSSPQSSVRRGRSIRALGTVGWRGSWDDEPDTR